MDEGFSHHDYLKPYNLINPISLLDNTGDANTRREPKQLATSGGAVCKSSRVPLLHFSATLYETDSATIAVFEVINVSFLDGAWR